MGDKDFKYNFWRTKNQKEKILKQNLIPSLEETFHEQTQSPARTTQEKENEKGKG